MSPFDRIPRLSRAHFSRIVPGSPERSEIVLWVMVLATLALASLGVAASLFARLLG